MVVYFPVYEGKKSLLKLHLVNPFLSFKFLFSLFTGDQAWGSVL